MEKSVKHKYIGCQIIVNACFSTTQVKKLNIANTPRSPLITFPHLPVLKKTLF